VISHRNIDVASHINYGTTMSPGQSGRGEPIAQTEDGETKMTTETNSVLNTVKEAFAPVTDALKNLQNLKFPRLP